jgi:hypothetical protein
MPRFCHCPGVLTSASYYILPICPQPDRGAAGTIYKYDLSDPSQQLRYEVDPMAQMKDSVSIDPRREIDQSGSTAAVVNINLGNLQYVLGRNGDITVRNCVAFKRKFTKRKIWDESCQLACVYRTHNYLYLRLL